VPEKEIGRDNNIGPDVDALADRFATELEAVSGSPQRGADALAVASTVLGPPPAAVAVDNDAELDAMAAALADAGYEVIRPRDAAFREQLPDTPLGITRCAAAIADTGTLLLRFDRDHPRSTSLVPRAHLAVVHDDDLVPSLPHALERVSALGPLPSGMACITGPSRSADIEQILTLGVHGPAQVHVVLP